MTARIKYIIAVAIAFTIFGLSFFAPLKTATAHDVANHAGDRKK